MIFFLLEVMVIVSSGNKSLKQDEHSDSETEDEVFFGTVMAFTATYTFWGWQFLLRLCFPLPEDCFCASTFLENYRSISKLPLSSLENNSIFEKFLFCFGKPRHRDCSSLVTSDLPVAPEQVCALYLDLPAALDTIDYSIFYKLWCLVGVSGTAL